MRISGIVNESIVDGTGYRAAIFFQGCPHGCPGCHNPETHDPNGGTERTADEILEPILKNEMLDGITLSGGEPFFQAEAALTLASRAKAAGLNVWTYTGYTWEALRAAHNPVWDALIEQSDVLVDGRFILEQRTLDKPFAGSRNQRVIDVAESLKTGTVVEKTF